MTQSANRSREGRPPPVDADIVAAAAERGLTLSASLLAVEPAKRVDAAEEIWRRHVWAHADVIDGLYGSRPSVSLDDIFDLALLNPGRTDVHLMVDDPIAWCERLPRVQRVTVQLHDSLDIPAVSAAARAIAAELWWAVDAAFASGDKLARFLAGAAGGGETAPDGVLVLLTPPGQDGFALDPTRLPDVREARLTVDSVGVDGGVTLDRLDEIAAAGARYVVCGRSLFNQVSP